MKNVAVSISRLGKALKSGIAFDGSSIEGFARIIQRRQESVVCVESLLFLLKKHNNQLGFRGVVTGVKYER